MKLNRLVPAIAGCSLFGLALALGIPGVITSRLRQALDPRGHVLVEWRAREPVAMLTCRELIRCDAVLEFLTFAIRIPETGAVRERDIRLAWKLGLRYRPGITRSRTRDR